MRESEQEHESNVAEAEKKTSKRGRKEERKKGRKKRDLPAEVIQNQ